MWMLQPRAVKSSIQSPMASRAMTNPPNIPGDRTAKVAIPIANGVHRRLPGHTSSDHRTALTSELLAAG